MERTSTLTKFLHLVRLLWLDAALPDRLDAWAHLSALVAIQLVKGKIATVISWTGRAQLESLGRGWRDVVRACLVHMSVVLFLSPVDVVFHGLLRRLRFKWSRFLTQLFLGEYVRVQCEEHAGTNFDQQIAEDVDKFVGLVLDLGFNAFEAVVHLSFLVHLLTELAPALGTRVMGHAVVGTVMTAWLGGRLPRLHSSARAAENEYRYALTRVRENAEPIMLFGGEWLEERRLRDRHAYMQDRVERMKGCKDRVEWFSKTFRSVAAITPAFVLGVGNGEPGKDEQSHSVSHSHSHSHGHGHSHGHVHGESDGHGSLATRVGGFVQASEAFDHILFHLFILAENLNDFSKLSSLVESLDAMKTRYDAARAGSANKGGISLVDASPTDPYWLSMNSLTIRVPTQRGDTRVLVEAFDADVRKGESLLIQGASGVGKTTLLRAIAGLWKLGSGTIYRPSGSDLFYIPQAPYMCIGSLRQQVMYPLDESYERSKSRDEEIEELLRKVNLGRLLERKVCHKEAQNPLDRVERWSELLSIGEQQRMGFARLLFAKPLYAVLDEATSACDEDNESNLYQLLSGTCKGWLSIGHRTSIEQFHTEVIQLTPPTHATRTENS